MVKVESLTWINGRRELIIVCCLLVCCFFVVDVSALKSYFAGGGVRSPQQQHVGNEAAGGSLSFSLSRSLPPAHGALHAVRHYEGLS